MLRPVLIQGSRQALVKEGPAENTLMPRNRAPTLAALLSTLFPIVSPIVCSRAVLSERSPQELDDSDTAELPTVLEYGTSSAKAFTAMCLLSNEKLRCVTVLMRGAASQARLRTTGTSHLNTSEEHRALHTSSLRPISLKLPASAASQQAPPEATGGSTRPTRSQPWKALEAASHPVPAGAGGRYAGAAAPSSWYLTFGGQGVTHPSLGSRAAGQMAAAWA